MKNQFAQIDFGVLKMFALQADCLIRWFPKKKIRLLSIEPVLAKVEPCDFKYNLCVSRKLKKNVLYTYDDLKQNKQYYPQKPLFLKSVIRKTDDWKLFS